MAPAVPPPPDAAAEFYRIGQRITATGLAVARDRFQRFTAADIDGSFRAVWGDLVATLSTMQLAAVRSAQLYVPAVLDEVGIAAPAAADIVPSAFVGASSGVPLEELLSTIPIQAKAASAAGQFAEQIEREAQELLDGIMQTQIADAAREATAADLAARPRVTGYVRMLNPPSCARCVILAGKHYKWNAGFQRHPRCDCRHIPVDEDVSGEYRTDPDAYMRQIGPAERQRILGKAGAKAFDMGADLGQVVNARRGVYTAQAYGRDVRVTREGTTKRGLAGQRLGDLAKQRGDRYRRSKTPRLMPESIFEIAQGRDDALRLLKLHGFVL